MDHLTGVLRDSQIIRLIWLPMAAIQTHCFIMLLLIAIDTLSGLGKAIYLNGFRASELKRIPWKMITYGAAVLSVRLMEISMQPNYEMTVLSRTLIAILILKETISIMKNLRMLGVPIPVEYLSYLAEKGKVLGLEKLFANGNGKMTQFRSDLEDLAGYPLASIEDPAFKRWLEIVNESWRKIYLNLEDMYREENPAAKEMSFHKISSILQLIDHEIQVKWRLEGLLGEKTMELRAYYEKSAAAWLEAARTVMESDMENREKRNRLMESGMVLLYQLYMEVMKQSKNG